MLMLWWVCSTRESSPGWAKGRGGSRCIRCGAWYRTHVGVVVGVQHKGVLPWVGKGKGREQVY